ncbi:hypothetical protein M885DRAFT_619666 [Pelagophyceae sp. CCMP2097]|nr:hypothetical protein M885DRAFT_619666 [Pelagophyceae sp. CCMP2097]
MARRLRLAALAALGFVGADYYCDEACRRFSCETYDAQLCAVAEALAGCKCAGCACAAANATAGKDVCESVCPQFSCHSFDAQTCAFAEALHGCGCAGCACGPANATAPACAAGCFGEAETCDDFAREGVSCGHLAEVAASKGIACDCGGCACALDRLGAQAGEIDACTAAPVDVWTEAALRAAVEDAAASCGGAFVAAGVVSLEGSLIVPLAVSRRILGRGPRASRLRAAGAHRIISVLPGASLHLESLALADGVDLAVGGGCVLLAAGAALTVEDVLFENCAGFMGGGVLALQSASARFDRAVFADCVALRLGGGFARVGFNFGDIAPFLPPTDAPGSQFETHFSASLVQRCGTVSGGGGGLCLSGRTLLEGVNVTRCSASGYGGGMATVTGTLVVARDVVIERCASLRSGGAVVASVRVALVFSGDSRIRDCSALVSGGGIFLVTSSTMVVDRGLSFERCHGLTGGGIFAYFSTSFLSLGGAAFVNCSAREAGGAIKLMERGVAHVYGAARFEGNVAPAGGALYLSAVVQVHLAGGAVFSGNVADAGGAVRLMATAELRVAGAVFELNAALPVGGGAAGASGAVWDGGAYSGGAVSADGACRIVATDAKFHGNVAHDGGGAISARDSEVLLRGDTVFENNAALGGNGGAVSVDGERSRVYVVHGADCALLRATLRFGADGAEATAGNNGACDGWFSISSTAPCADGAGCDARTFSVARDATGAAMSAEAAVGQTATRFFCLSPGETYDVAAYSTSSQGWDDGRLSLTLTDANGDDFTTELYVPSGAHAASATLATEPAPNHTAAAQTAAAANGAAAGGRRGPSAGPAVRFVGNTAQQSGAAFGGAIFAGAGARLWCNCVDVSSNVARVSGGGVFLEAKATLEGSVMAFVGNAASEASGGGLCASTLSVVEMQDSVAANNSAAIAGGFGAFSSSDLVALTNVDLSGNAVLAARDVFGGAVSLADVTAARFVGARFFGNRAAAREPEGRVGAAVRAAGGAVAARASTTTFEDVFFGDNAAVGGAGGALAVLSGELTDLDHEVAFVEKGCADVDVVVDFRRTTAQCLPIILADNRVDNRVTCEYFSTGCKTLRDTGLDCAGCACARQLQRHFTIVRAATAFAPAAVFTGVPATAAAVTRNFCLAEGNYTLQAFDNFSESWWGGSFHVEVDDASLLRKFVRRGDTVEAVSFARVPTGADSWFYASGDEFVDGRESAKLDFEIVLQPRLSTMHGNAATSGGGLYWEGANEPRGMGGVAFRGNDAPHGPDRATTGHSLVFVDADDWAPVPLAKARKARVCSAIPDVAAPAVAARSGERFSRHVTVALLDRYDQLMVAVEGIAVAEAPGARTISAAIARFDCGLAKFVDTVIVDAPGTAVALTVYTPRFSLAQNEIHLDVVLDACAVGESLASDGLRCDACLGDEFWAPKSGGDARGGGVCKPCKAGMCCATNDALPLAYRVLETLAVAEGWWRPSSDSTDVRRCVRPDACRGAPSGTLDVEPARGDGGKRGAAAAGQAGAAYCAPGNVGPLCNVCAFGTYLNRIDQKCMQCGARSKAALAVVLALLAALAVVNGALYCALAPPRKPGRGIDARWPRLGRGFSAAQRWLVSNRSGQGTARLKIAWATFQVISQMDWATGVEFPTPFAYVARGFALLELDLIDVVPAECVLGLEDFDYAQRFLTVSLSPLCILGVVGASYLAQRGRETDGETHTHEAKGSKADQPQISARRAPVPDDESKIGENGDDCGGFDDDCGGGGGGFEFAGDSHAALVQRHANVALVTLYLFLGPVSIFAFRAFPCARVAARRVLAADYSVSCGSRRWRMYQVYAGVIVALWPIGMPLGSAVLVYRYRNQINPRDLESEADAFVARRAHADIATFSFLWASYKPRFYYWESVESIRRVALTGGLVVIGSSTETRTFAGFTLAMVGLMVVDAKAPYADAGSNTVAVGAAWQIAICFVCLFLASSDSYGAVKAEYVGVALIAANCILVGAGAAAHRTDERRRHAAQAHAAELRFRSRELCLGTRELQHQIDSLRADAEAQRTAIRDLRRTAVPQRQRSLPTLAARPLVTAVDGASVAPRLDRADSAKPLPAGQMPAGPLSAGPLQGALPGAPLPTGPLPGGGAEQPGAGRRSSRLRGRWLAAADRFSAAGSGAGSGAVSRRPAYPCYVLSLARLRTIDRFVPHEAAVREPGFLEELTWESEAPHCAACIYVSHCAEGRLGAPDDYANTMLRWLQRLDVHLGLQKGTAVWIWFDTMSMPQRPGVLRRRALGSLVHYAALCGRFVPLLRDADEWAALYGGEDRVATGTMHNYLGDGMRRLELCAALCPRRFGPRVEGRARAWRPGPCNVRFRYHHDPDLAGVGELVRGEHLLAPLEAHLDDEDDRPIVADLVRELRATFAEYEASGASAWGATLDVAKRPTWLLPDGADDGADAPAHDAAPDWDVEHGARRRDAAFAAPVADFAKPAPAPPPTVPATPAAATLSLPTHIVEHFSFFVCSVDAQHRVLLWSDGAAEITGLAAPPDLESLRFRCDGDRAHALRVVARAFETQAPQPPFAVWLRAAEGLRFVALACHAVPSGDAVTLFGNVVDPRLLSLAVDAARARDDDGTPFLSDARAAAGLVETPADAPRGRPRFDDGDAALRALLCPPSFDAQDETSLETASQLSGDTAAEAPGPPETPPELSPPGVTIHRAVALPAALSPPAQHPGCFGLARVYLVSIDERGLLRGVAIDPESDWTPDLVRRGDAASGGRAGPLPPRGLYAFAHVAGEPFVRARVDGGGDARQWHALVGARDGDDVDRLAETCGASVGGGKLDVSDGGTLLRWFVDAGADDGPADRALGHARHVPLPLDLLWLLCAGERALAQWVPDGRARDDLRASGRLQALSARHVAVKVSTVDAKTYARALGTVHAARQARAELEAVKGGLREASLAEAPKGAAADDGPTPAGARNPQRRTARQLERLAAAQARWARAEVEVESTQALETALRGRRERGARRALGLLDERALRQDARLRAVAEEVLNSKSYLCKLNRYLYRRVMDYAALPATEARAARAHLVLAQHRPGPRARGAESPPRVRGAESLPRAESPPPAEARPAAAPLDLVERHSPAGFDPRVFGFNILFPLADAEP